MLAYVKDLKSSNIEHTNEVLSLGLGVEGLVDTVDEPLEHTSVDGLRQSSHCVDDLSNLNKR